MKRILLTRAKKEALNAHTYTDDMCEARFPACVSEFERLDLAMQHGHLDTRSWQLS